MEAIKYNSPIGEKKYHWSKMKVGDVELYYARHLSHRLAMEKSIKASLYTYNNKVGASLEITVFGFNNEIRVCRVK